MHRIPSLAFGLALVAASSLANAQARSPQPSPPSPASPQAPPGLASGLDALRTSDYARADRELASVRGAGQAKAELGLARSALEQGRFADVERHANAASASTSERAAAATLRARALAAQGKLPEALRALEPFKDAPGEDGRSVRLLLGEYEIATGHRSLADDPLMKIVEEYNSGTIANGDARGLAQVGRAAYLLRSPKDANQAFNESERADKHDDGTSQATPGRGLHKVDTLLWRAELFLDKYDPGHAEEALKEALSIAPKRADLLVAMARVKLDQALDFDAADALVKDALATNPKIAGAFAVRAGIALRDMDLPLAESTVAQGLAIDPNDLELWSLRAAGKFLGDDRAGYAEAKRQTFLRDAEYARFYEIVGDFAEWEHRYDDIVTMMREATQLDPDDGKAWAELGLTLMRNGDETAGLEALQKSWKKDHFNVRVFNTLNLYEQTIPTAYETVADGVFRLRYPKDEKAVLERYVPKMLAEAWGSMKARYGFVPTTPVQVELYSTREQFSVRTSGLPNIGIQGVCFGRVVAALSPKSEPFNWGNVVWHELGHVFAIQLSKNHVPRWFTEGLSEYETIARRPEWRRELDPELYMAIRAGRLPGAVDMNRAFTHATDGADVTVAYYAASQMLVFTAEAFGMPKIVQALRLWGQGVRTPDVIERAFGVSASDYDTRYRSWEMARLARYGSQFLFDDHAKPLLDARAAVAAKPADAHAHVDLALSLLRDQKGDEAKQEIDRALALDPKEVSGQYLAYKLALHGHDLPAAAEHLAAIQRAGADGYMIQMGLAELAQERKDRAAARAALEAASRFDPSQSEPLKALFDLANEDKRDLDALDALRKLAQLEQHDRRAWRLLLEKLVAANQWAEAARIGESAIFVDVESAEVHTLYAKALSRAGAHDRAIFELESALLCSAPPKELATAHALLAAEYLAARNLPQARAHKDAALKLDPDNADARALRIP